MARPFKAIAELGAGFGAGSLRDYWRAINRHDRAVAEQKRARRKQTDQARPKCRCKAFPFPHRLGSGGCRHPDPPAVCWEPKKRRRYRNRYTGLRRQIARAQGWHPIKDRALIDQMMPSVLSLAKQLKQTNRNLKFRNMRVKAVEVEASQPGMTVVNIRLTADYQTAGPAM